LQTENERGQIQYEIKLITDENKSLRSERDRLIAELRTSMTEAEIKRIRLTEESERDRSELKEQLRKKNGKSRCTKSVSVCIIRCNITFYIWIPNVYYN
jgi:hypothetical protein